MLSSIASCLPVRTHFLAALDVGMVTPIFIAWIVVVFFGIFLSGIYGGHSRKSDGWGGVLSSIIVWGVYLYAVRDFFIGDVINHPLIGSLEIILAYAVLGLGALVVYALLNALGKGLRCPKLQKLALWVGMYVLFFNPRPLDAPNDDPSDHLNDEHF